MLVGVSAAEGEGVDAVVSVTAGAVTTVTDFVAGAVGLVSVKVESAEVEGEDALGILARPIGTELVTLDKVASAVVDVRSCWLPAVVVAAAVAVAAFPFASGLSVVNPPIGPVNVGLMVTKTTVTA